MRGLTGCVVASRLAVAFGMTAGLLVSSLAAKHQITEQQRAYLIRELTSEHGTAKVVIPRSKKALVLNPKGGYDEDQWLDAIDEHGPAARLGDLVEITKVAFKGRRLVIELNHGIKGGRRWWHRVQVGGTAGRGTSLGQGQNVYAPGGTKMALVFEEKIPPLTSDEVKKMFEPYLDFNQRSATELFIEKLSEEFQKAVKEERVLVGMDKDTVLLAKGKPQKRVRDFDEGIETEDWIYGIPPGGIIFVTFEDGEVIRVKEAYAKLGGQVKREEDLNEQP